MSCNCNKPTNIPCGCESCEDTNPGGFCPIKDLSTDCVLYTGDRLSCSGIEADTVLTDLIIQLDEFICDKFNEAINYLTLTNVGSGAQIYKGVSVIGEKEIRSLASRDNSVTITQNENEIDLSVLENSQLNLQEVTDNGNETTNFIVTDNREGFILRSGGQRVGQLGTTNDSGSNFGVLILNEIGNGEVSLSPNSSITYSNTSSRSFLPDNQQKVLAVSVNGLFADQFGDISLPIDESVETNTNLILSGTSQNQDLELQYQNELSNNQNINLSSIINRSGWQDLLTSNRNEIGRFYSNIDTSVFSTGTSIYETLTEFLVTEVGGKITNFGYRSEDGTVVEIDANKLDVSSSSNVFEDTQLTSSIVTPAQSGLVYTLSFQKTGNIVFVAGNIINNGATIPSSGAILNITNSEYFPSRILALISSNTSALGAGSSDRDYYINVTDTSITPSNSFIPDSGGFLNGHNIIINGFYFTN